MDLVRMLERCLNRFCARVRKVRNIARVARHQPRQAARKGTSSFSVRPLRVHRGIGLQQFNRQPLQLGRIVPQQRGAKTAHKVGHCFAARVNQRRASRRAVRRVQTGRRKQIGQLRTAVAAVMQAGIGPCCPPHLCRIGAADGRGSAGQFIFRAEWRVRRPVHFGRDFQFGRLMLVVVMPTSCVAQSPRFILIFRIYGRRRFGRRAKR
jgi:hypothetical protein